MGGEVPLRASREYPRAFASLGSGGGGSQKLHLHQLIKGKRDTYIIFLCHISISFVLVYVYVSTLGCSIVSSPYTTVMEEECVFIKLNTSFPKFVTFFLSRYLTNHHQGC